MTLGEIINKCQLEKIEIEILLSYLIDKDRSFLTGFPEYKLTSYQRRKLGKYISRRQRNEPLPYILGFKDFFGLRFKIDKRALIPRPETENLVEEVVRHVQSSKIKGVEVVDVGTGSGCIAISLAKNIPSAKIYAVDIDPNALDLAKENASTHGVEDKIIFLAGDLLNTLDKKVDIIVANLPYIPTSTIPFLQPEIYAWEPKTALDGGKDGMVLYKRLFNQAKEKLNKSGVLFYELDGRIFIKKF